MSRTPTIELIRETLYVLLGETLGRSGSLRALRLERVTRILEEGVGVHDAAERRGGGGAEEDYRRSVEGRALAMTRLKPFRECQTEVFKILAGFDG